MKEMTKAQTQLVEQFRRDLQEFMGVLMDAIAPSVRARTKLRREVLTQSRELEKMVATISPQRMRKAIRDLRTLDGRIASATMLLLGMQSARFEQLTEGTSYGPDGMPKEKKAKKAPKKAT
jgi:hypothetical protein